MTELQAGLVQAAGLITDATAMFLRTSTSPNKFVRLNPRKTELLMGLALLRAQLAWETFVETSFARYLCGAQSKSGYQPLLLVPKYSSLAAAHTAILGGLRYVSWHPMKIRDLAKTFFQNGDPYETAVSSVLTDLNDVGAIRNCFAHRSEYARGQFRSVVIRHLGYVPRGLTPGRFLASFDTSSKLTFAQKYFSVLGAAATAIAP